MRRKDLSFLLRQPEGYNLEFKRSISKKIATSICAFANAGGGKIIVGVDDNNKPVGIKSLNKSKSQIQTIVKAITPNLDISIDEHLNILIVTVPEGLNKPYSVSGRFFIREGANSQKLSRDQIIEFLHKEGRIQFESIPNKEFNLETDIDEAQYAKFLSITQINTQLNQIDLLNNLNLLKDGFMKNLGILLFSNDPLRFSLNSTIQCVIFQGKDRLTILDRKTFSEDIITNYKNALLYLKQHLKTRYIIEDAGPRKEVLEIPEAVLREAILNAIAHRDYSIYGAGVSIGIFPDRIEITNPGGLTGGITVDMLGRTSLARNLILFGIMFRMKLVEQVGTGILRMKNFMKNAHLPEPDFAINDDWFTIILKRKDEQEYFTSNKIQNTDNYETEDIESKILALIKQQPDISKKEIAKKLNLSEGVVKYRIKRLKEIGRITHKGSLKGGYWKIVEKKE